jgi:hypothetical protein
MGNVFCMVKFHYKFEYFLYRCTYLQTHYNLTLDEALCIAKEEHLDMLLNTDHIYDEGQGMGFGA